MIWIREDLDSGNTALHLRLRRALSIPLYHRHSPTQHSIKPVGFTIQEPPSPFSSSSSSMNIARPHHSCPISCKQALSSSLAAAQHVFVRMPHRQISSLGGSICPAAPPTAALASDSNGNGDEIGNAGTTTSKGSGTTARGRRLLKVREDKRKREFDRIHNYPSWAKVLENACGNDHELRAVLGDSIGDPEQMRKKVQQRVREKGPDFNKSKTGSILAFKVSFRDFNPVDSHIWFQFYGSPSDRDVDLIGNVIQSWYVMGRLGAYNSSNLQLANSSMDYDPLYDSDKGSNVLPSSFHDISDIEFQDSWGRIWVDLGTCDLFAIDVLLNCLTVLSSEYVGIQQVVFGGRCMGDWEEGMISPEDGYKSFKI